MDKDNDDQGAGEMEFEASGDSLVIAGGLHEIARAIEKLAKAVAKIYDDSADPDLSDIPEQDYYLDGRRK